MPKGKPVQIAILGTGGMAHEHARQFGALRDRCEIVAACDIDPAKAGKFAAKFDIPHAFGDAAEMLAQPGLDAVVNVTPDPAHHPLSLRVLAAGKHILCEKPLAENYPHAAEMAAAAQEAGVINMVNFTYRNAPALETAHELVQAGELGEIRHVEASYLQSWLPTRVWGDYRENPQWLWRLSSAHGSKGVLGDLGVHILDFASYPVCHISKVRCLLRTFPKPGGDRIGDYVFDVNDSAVITAEYENGALGVIHTSRWTTGHENSLTLRIFGTRGAIAIDLDQSQSELEICRGENIHSAEWDTLPCSPVPPIAKRFLDGIRTNTNPQPDFARGAEIQQILDACFESHETQSAIRIS